jgi:hypothetical protein
MNNDIRPNSAAQDELPPHDTDSEQAAIGAVLLALSEGDTPAVERLIEQLRVSDFYEHRHQVIFKTISRLQEAGQLRSALDIRSALEAEKNLDAVGQWPYVSGLAEQCPGVVTAEEHHIPKMKDRAARRLLMQVCKRGSDLAQNPQGEITILFEDLQDAAEAITLPTTGIDSRPLIDFTRLPEDDSTLLIGPGPFMSRATAALIVAATGLGKSTIGVTLASRFALGMEALGFVPTRPLKSVIIQAEDEDCDLGELAEGIRADIEPTPRQVEQLRRNLIILTERSRTGAEFLRLVRRVLRKERPDLLWINPLSAYFGADLNDQRAVAWFCRNKMNPMLAEFGCALMVIHHTTKPSKEQRERKGGELAYAGSGSSDLANWAREVIVLQEQAPGVCRLACTKRWRKLKWTDPDGNLVNYKTITHGLNGFQYWRLADAKDLESAGIQPYSEAAMLELVPLEGIDKAELKRAAAAQFRLSERQIATNIDKLVRSAWRRVEGIKLKCALLKESKRPRSEVYPDKASGRDVVWIQRIGSSFENEKAA